MSDSVRGEKKEEWELLHSKDSSDSFTADACNSLFPQTCCVKEKKLIKNELEMCDEKLRCTGMLRLSSKTYWSCDTISNKIKLSSKVLSKNTIQDSGDVPIAKYQNMLDKTEKVNSTNRGFRTRNHCVATY